MPRDTHRILAMVFNNLWFTNFVADSHGVMEFQFDAAWKKTFQGDGSARELAESLWAEPPVLINPGAKESPIYMNRLYRP